MHGVRKLTLNTLLGYTQNKQMETESYCPQAYMLVSILIYSEEANGLLVPKK